MTAALVSGPVGGQLGQRHAAGQLLGFLLCLAELRADPGRLITGVDPRPRGEHLPERRMGVDRLVHPRLRDRGVVDLAVAVAAVPDQVDDDVARKRVAERGGQPRDARHGRQVLAVHVEDRDRQPVGDVGGQRRRVQLLLGGREPDLVVDDDVNAATHREAWQVGHVERLGRDALARKRRVSVQHDRHDAPSRVRALARLAGPGPPERDWVDRLQMTRVGDQLDAQFAAGARAVAAGRPHVVFHVAAAEHALRVGVLEAGEDVERRTADRLHHHVEPPAVAHADERLLEPLRRAGLEHLVEQRDERGHAFEREPFRSRVAAVQHLFEDVGPDQAFEHRRPVDAGDRLLHPLPHPLAALRVRNVHELGADRAAVPAPRLCGLLAAGRQVRVRPRRPQPERVDSRLEVSPAPEGVEYAVVVRHGWLPSSFNTSPALVSPIGLRRTSPRPSGHCASIAGKLVE